MEKDLLTSSFYRLRVTLSATARSILGPRAEVDDVLQDAFCRLWSRKESIRDRSDASGLLVTTVRNVSIDAVRRKASRPVTTELDDQVVACQSEMPDEERQQSELMVEVAAVIDRTLTPRQREILYRRERDGWEIAELAGCYGLTEANVRMILSRARTAVREAYRKNSEI